MRAIVVIILSAFLNVIILASASPVYAAAPGAMSGKGDWATRGYNRAAKQNQQKMMATPKRAKTVKGQPQ